MKKVLLAIAAVATITSCSQNEEFENPAQNAEINFSTIVSKSTRAVIIENKDFKKFTVGDVTFGVGQINSMSRDELQEIKSKLLPYMEKARQAQQVDMVFFMLTNIIQESTELLCCGNGAREQVLEAFDLSDDIEDILLKGVVSRKKQLIPAFVISLQQ